MEWSDDLSLKLIESYRDKPILWDPTSMHYKLTKKKVDVWKSIADEFKCDIPEVKRKMDSLLASYRREMRREGTTHSGMGPDDLYHSKWFAFKAMQFLNDKFRPRATQNTEIDQGEDRAGQNDELEEQEDDVVVEDENAPEENSTEASQSSVIREETTKRKAPSPKLPSKKRVQEDPRINAAFNVLQALGEKRAARVEKDECVLYGEYVASQLAKFDERMRAIVKHKIGSILFEAEMGRTQHQVLHPFHNWSGSSSPMGSATASPTPSTSYARQHEQGVDEPFHTYHQL